MAKRIVPMNAAKKAAETRKARSEFVQTYGTEAYDVVSMLASKMSDHHIMDLTWIPRSSLAAYKANLTRGTYDHILSRCNLK